MKALSSTGIAISLLSGFLFLALVAQVYYLVWWKKRRTTTKRQLLEEEDDISVSSGKELLYLICWKKPSCSLRSTVPQEICNSNNPDCEEGIEAEMMRLHNLSGPPRFLFTIKEETREDLESEDGSRKNSKGKSFSDNESTPYLTPLSSPPFFTPPMTPLDYGFKPLFESFKSSDSDMIKMKSFSSSPPPKFKFLRDAEDKLYKKILTEEAMRVHKSCPSSPSPSHSKVGDEADGSLITIIIGKNREKGQQQNQQYSNSSQSPIHHLPFAHCRDRNKEKSSHIRVHFGISS